MNTSGYPAVLLKPMSLRTIAWATLHSLASFVSPNGRQNISFPAEVTTTCWFGIGQRAVSFKRFRWWIRAQRLQKLLSVASGLCRLQHQWMIPKLQKPSLLHLMGKYIFFSTAKGTCLMHLSQVFGAQMLRTRTNWDTETSEPYSALWKRS